MAIFYAVVEDDPLDSGGRVLMGNRRSTITGPDGRPRRMAFLGDQAWCDTCKSLGEIVASPGSPQQRRIFDATIGQRQALGDDLVLCKCAKHPRIIPMYGRKFSITVNSATAVAQTATANSPTATADSVIDDLDEIIEQSFALLDDGTTPVDGYRYDLYSNGLLHTHKGSYSNGETASVQGQTTLRLVTWIERDSASKDV
ncbi:PAAR domain-containing protein [Dyella psychrodurans]|uniref:PAAR domain-containing protein n=1 Tax=Dyella psychrodurans TaxID=1927960 RepID=A0A370WVF9_9GAMM|nr:PAAR domain-containing protein [Dyella psychrodurans]RDS80016.1 PAAR domain-containing protein [Dyella psychrodurans]